MKTAGEAVYPSKPQKNEKKPYCWETRDSSCANCISTHEPGIYYGKGALH